MHRLLCLAILIFLHCSVHAQSGNLNFNFNGGAFTTLFGITGSQVEDLAVQSDGKVVAAGLAFIDGVARFALARYNLDGSLDASFGGTGKITTLIGSECWAYALVIQPDGKIVAGGYAKTNTLDFALARYNADGSPDNSFGNAGIVTTDVGLTTDNLLDNDKIKDLALHTDGKIVAVGESFNGTNFDIALVQYLPSGAVLSNTTFSAGSFNDFGNRVAIRPDGKILITGCTYTTNNTADIVLAQYLSNGLNPDPSFGNSGLVVSTIGPGDDFGKGLALQADGRIVVCGATWQSIGSFDIVVIRYTNDGEPDGSFGTEGKATVDISGSFDDAIGIHIQADGKIIVAGSTVNGPHDDFLVTRFTSYGYMDTGFGNGGIMTTPIGSYSDIAYAYATTGNKIYLGGVAYRTSTGGAGDFALASFMNNDAPLPLRMISFTAENTGNGIKLNWETGSEINIRSFIVERSADGRNFQTLRELPSSSGSPAAVNKYTILDPHPLAPMNYYRLKIVETDNSYSYSRIIAVKTNISSPELFPNPARTFTNLQLPSTVQGNIRVNLFDATGKMIRELTHQAWGSSVITIDLSGLASGNYFLRTSSEGSVFTTRLVKE